jgi:DNA-binding NarL/FixJ family response regulator
MASNRHPLGLPAVAPSDLAFALTRRGRVEVAIFSFQFVTSPEGGSLTAAELAVFSAMLLGRSNADIARARGTSPRTVANQVASILKKLGCRSRAECAALYLASTRTSPSK